MTKRVGKIANPDFVNLEIAVTADISAVSSVTAFNNRTDYNIDYKKNYNSRDDDEKPF